MAYKFDLNLLKRCLSKDVIKIIDDYKIVDSNYSEFLDRFSKLIKSFDLKDSLEISILYTRMLNSGLLSENLNFKPTDDKAELLELDCLGPTVFTGAACCRHSSSLLNDILNYNHYESINFPLKNGEERHLVNLVDIKGSPYVWDAYNNLLVEKKDGKYVVGDTKYDFFEDDVDIVNSKKIKLSNFDSKILRTISNDEILYREQKFTCNMGLLMKFFVENQHLYSDTSKRLKLIMNEIKKG